MATDSIPRPSDQPNQPPPGIGKRESPAVGKHVHLRSSLVPAFHIVNVVNVVIDADGTITAPPNRFYASQALRQIVQWDITNNCNETVTVTVTDFLLKTSCSDDKGNTPVYPFNWLTSQSISLAAGQEGSIDGRVSPLYHRHNALDDCLSYTIRVTVGGSTVDYDPDGDIKP